MDRIVKTFNDTFSSVGIVVFLSTLFLYMASAEREFPVASVSVPRYEGNVSIDGVLDEASWERAMVLKPLVKNGDGERGLYRTQVRLFASDEALYIGWEIDDDDIQATFTARDSHFWEEEVVEFFLATNEITDYFEFQWNPLGGIFDARIRNRLGRDGKSKGIEGDWSYTAAKMKSRVQVNGTVANDTDTDHGWVVEVAIPYSDLGIAPPKKGTQWRANFYRFNRGGSVSVEKQSWSPTLDPSFHQPSRFGILRFD